MGFAPNNSVETVPFDIVITGNGGIVTGDYDIPTGHYVLGAWSLSGEATGTGNAFLWLEYAQGGTSDTSVNGRVILESETTFSAGSGHSAVAVTNAAYGKSSDGKLTAYMGASVNTIDYRFSGYLIRIR